MSVSGTEHLEQLNALLYTRPAGRSIIGYAIDEIIRLRAENTELRVALIRQNATAAEGDV